MDSDDGKEKGGVTAVRKGEAMKSLEKATADYEKAKEKMEASKARYEADLKRFKAAEIAKTEAENLEIVKIIRAMDMSIPELEAFKKRKYQYMAKDREGRDVFLADSNYVLQMAQMDFKHIKFHFTSEF